MTKLTFDIPTPEELQPHLEQARLARLEEQQGLKAVPQQSQDPMAGPHREPNRDRQVLEACYKGDTQQLKKLMEEGVEFGTFNMLFARVLHYNKERDEVAAACFEVLLSHPKCNEAPLLSRDDHTEGLSVDSIPTLLRHYDLPKTAKVWLNAHRQDLWYWEDIHAMQDNPLKDYEVLSYLSEYDFTSHADLCFWGPIYDELNSEWDQQYLRHETPATPRAQARPRL